jgi:hypothetical protein
MSTRFDINSNLTIRVSDDGDWLISTEEREFPLKEVNDFFRVWLLLERSFLVVRAALDEVARNARATEPFPFAKLIASALKAKSTQLTDRAVFWVSFLTIEDKASLKRLLVDVRDSKWASQKSRQLARKYVQEIVRSEQRGAK